MLLTLAVFAGGLIAGANGYHDAGVALIGIGFFGFLIVGLATWWYHG